MTVAKLDLCKELLGISEWGSTPYPEIVKTDKQWFIYSDKSNMSHPYLLNGRGELDLYDYSGAFVYPAYDADFVLTKVKDYDFTIVNLNTDTLSLTSDSLDEPEAAILGGSLAEVLTLFAIELFKQGILVKERHSL